MANQGSLIGAAKVHSTKESVISAVSEAMDTTKWDKYIKSSPKQPKKIFIKVNLLSHQVVPGHCTSPYVLEGVIKKLQEGNFEIFVGDANVATIKQVETAAYNWGILDVCKKYCAKFVNLSKQPVKEIDFSGEIFKKMYFPQILTEVDYIITIPVPKTHNVSTMTCALKNQWGCIPTFRHQYHSVVHKAIAEINKALSVKFVVCDATVCSEGEGPRTSTPKVCDYIFASSDLVAMDSFIADFMGMDKEEVKHIFYSEKIGLGSSKYVLLGEINELLDKNGKVVSQNFKKHVQKNHPIVFLEMKLRKIPVLSYIIFKTFLFKLPAFIASRYNSIYWHQKVGKKAAKELINKYPLYKEEFEQLILNQKQI